MGYVNESRTFPPFSTSTSWTRLDTGVSASRTLGPLFLKNQSQYGYRSGPLSPEEIARFRELSGNGRWGRQAEMLDALERIQSATTPIPFSRTGSRGVHSRDYTVWQSVPAYTSGGGFVNPLVPFRYNGAGAITSIDTYFPPTPPSEAEMAGIAGSMMRGYSPARPDANLTRFLGELRDAPQMARLNSYIPNSIGDFGSGHLNLQFGVLPTASDIQKISEAVLHADKLSRQFVKDSAHLVQRRASKTLQRDSRESTGTLHAANQTRNIGGVAFRVDLGAPGISYLGPTFDTYVGYTGEIRAFSTFEYFVGDPTGYTTRMDSYVQKARKVLGGGLDQSTVYALTPWTWLFDWFVDIGGLLRYQQQVADYNLVQRSGGFVWEARTSVSVRLGGGRMLGTTDAYFGTPTTLTAVKRNQKRRRGSPYSMTPTWSLNEFQWGIVGALGLLKAPKVPFFGD